MTAVARGIEAWIKRTGTTIELSDGTVIRNVDSGTLRQSPQHCAEPRRHNKHDQILEPCAWNRYSRVKPRWRSFWVRALFPNPLTCLPRLPLNVRRRSSAPICSRISTFPGQPRISLRQSQLPGDLLEDFEKFVGSQKRIANATDLVFYYVGHGGETFGNRQFYLATRFDPRQGREQHQPDYFRPVRALQRRGPACAST